MPFLVGTQYKLKSPRLRIVVANILIAPKPLEMETFPHMAQPQFVG